MTDVGSPPTKGGKSSRRMGDGNRTDQIRVGRLVSLGKFVTNVVQ